MSKQSEIDRLIEAGLALYGMGDLDGALQSWEQALARDPDNEQAASYVEYVRDNYDLLTNEVAAEYDERHAPFGIADDDPEYLIEIMPGEELGPPADASQPMYIDPLDAGWDIEPEELPRPTGSRRASRELPLHAQPPAEVDVEQLPDLEVPLDLGLPMPGQQRTRSADVPEVTVELEADEPPPPVQPPPISFDDETREYPGGPPAKKPLPLPPEPAPAPLPAIELEPELYSFGTSPPSSSELPGFDSAPEPITSEFRPEHTPGFSTETPPGGFSQFTPTFDTPTSGFGTQVTDIRKRDTGFVQPVAAPPPEDAEPELGPAGATLPPANAPAMGRANTRSTPPAGSRAKRPSQVPDGLKMTLRTPGEPLDPLEFEVEPPRARTRSRDLPQERPTLDPLADDLINSLPSPTPAASVGNSKKPITKEMPPATRQPAPATAELKAASSTRDFPQQKTEKLPSGVRFAVQEMPSTEAPTRDLPTGKLPALAREIVGAPTRDLGLRAAANALAHQPPPPVPSEEEPTTLRRARAIDLGDGTRSDVVLPFDPIDARSAQILDEVDEDVPKHESKEDRTRRRISKLFERAIEWNKTGELDRAVAAIDLALSEDPNSALAQKLIHRNRETMMMVFQSFLGDLERQPILARPLHELANAPISPRAAFLLSRIDGTLSLDEILDVSGMPRLEAYRYLCQLFLRNILR